MASQVTSCSSTHFDALFRLISRLRAKDGCPWDRKQTPDTLSVYLIEEMYELVEAIIADDTDAIREELGDVIFQILFLANLYQEQDRIVLDEVLDQITDKMIRRHPHVFGRNKLENAHQVKQWWRQIKKREKAASQSLLESIPTGMPAFMRAYRISERVAEIGFDWQDLQSVISQAESEWREFKAEVNTVASQKEQNPNLAMEFGDVLFTMVNVAMLAGIHPEKSLIQSIQKFISRFQGMESMAADQNKELEAFSREELELLWKRAKQKK